MKINDKYLPKFVVIETQILTDNRISASEKLLYSYICLLANNERLSCFATNKHLSRIFNLKTRQIQNCLHNLKKYNYITIIVEKGNRRFINTTINQFLDSRKKISEEMEKIDIDFEYDWLGVEDNQKDSE